MFQRVFQREDRETQRHRGHKEEKKRRREEEEKRRRGEEEKRRRLRNPKSPSGFRMASAKWLVLSG